MSVVEAVERVPTVAKKLVPSVEELRQDFRFRMVEERFDSGRWKKLDYEARDAASAILYELYREGYSLSTLAAAINFSVATVYNWFKRNPEWVRRSPTDWTSSCRRRPRYRVNNQGVFAKIDSPEKAYWLGFLWADGCVVSVGGRFVALRVELHRSDREHLEKLCEFLGSDAPVKDVLSQDRFEHSRVEFWNDILASDLATLGLQSRRSERNVSVPSVKSELMRDLMKGMFDGDGDLCRGHKSKFPLSGWIVGLAGNRAVIAAWRRYICFEVLGRNYPDFKNGTNERNRKLALTGPAAIIALEHLFKEGDIALNSHVKLASLLIAAWHNWSRMGLGVAERGDGLRFVNTEVISALQKGELVQKIKLADERAEKYWRF